MPSTTVNVTGPDKENVTAVTIGASRWGHNGADFGTARDVAAGQATFTAYLAGGEESSGDRDIRDEETLTVTVDARDDDIGWTLNY